MQPSYPRQKEPSTYCPRKVALEDQDDLRTTPCFNYTEKKSEKKIRRDSFKEPKLDDFVLGQCKGQGRFGKVYLAVHKKTGMIFALKKIRK